MAEIQKAIVIDGVHTNLIDPSSGKSINYKEVTNWYDGTPMNDSKADGNLYRKKDNIYLRKVIDKDGELFLEKDTVAQLRALTSYEILLLKAGVFKGIKLNGYYTKGDTPSSINYYISSTSSIDNGGSIFEVQSTKFEHIFRETINPQYFGLVNNNIINQYDILNNTLGLGLNIQFPLNWDISVDVSETVNLNLQSNTNIDLNKSTIRVISNNLGRYYLFNLENKSNVIISNGKIIGDRTSHIGTTGEWGYGIRIAGGNNILITNMSISNFWGDGIALVPSSGIKPTNVTITKNLIDNNRRQGISVISGNGIFIDGNKITNTNGTLPEAAIDIEADPNGEDVENVTISNNILEGNSGAGVLKAYNTNFCRVISNYIKDNRYGVRVAGSVTKNTRNSIIQNNKIYNSSDIAMDISYNSSTNILNNEIKNSTTIALRLYASIDTKVQNNIIDTSGSTGISVNIGSTNCDISYNTINNVTASQVILLTSDSKKINVSFNDINSSNTYGILVNNNTVLDSTLFCNTFTGTFTTKILNNGVRVSESDIKSFGDQKSAAPAITGYERGHFVYNKLPSDSTPVGYVCINGASNIWRPFGFIGEYKDTGSPEGVLTAPIGSRYTDMSNGDLYMKKTGVSNTGWVNIYRTATTSLTGLVRQSTAVTDSTVANATDLATAIALVNDLKSKLNAKLAADRTSGQQLT